MKHSRKFFGERQRVAARVRRGGLVFALFAVLMGWHERAPGPTSTGEMVWIPGGEFSMGIDNPMFPDAQPVHRVRVNGFWLDTTEVTSNEFSRFVAATG